jgi:hypothetical protein
MVILTISFFFLKKKKEIVRITMLSVFLVALLLVHQVVGKAPKTLSYEEIRRLKVVNDNSTFSPTQYLVTALYKDGKTCEGEPFQWTGLGFGTCMAGSGYSIKYTSPSQDDQHLKYITNYYASEDCTGPTTSNIPTEYGMICYPTNGSGLKFSLVNSVTPWEGLGEGVASQVFTDMSVCSSGGGSNTFSFTKLNVCFEISNKGQSAAYDKSEVFTSCESNKVEYTIYDDNACQVKPVKNSGALIHCQLSEAKDYQSVLCGKAN